MNTKLTQTVFVTGSSHQKSARRKLLFVSLSLWTERINFHAWVGSEKSWMFLLAVGVGIFQLLSKHSIVDLMGSAPAGKPLIMGVAATMVAGGFIIGAVITPDFSRFARSGKDVFWMTMIGTILGELGINMIAVLMALAAKTSDVVSMNNTVERSESSIVTGQSYIHQVYSKTASKEDYALRKVPLTWHYSWSKLVVSMLGVDSGFFLAFPGGLAQQFGIGNHSNTFELRVC